MEQGIAARVAAQDWAALAATLDAHGAAATGPLLTPEECHSLRALWPEAAGFRSHVIMARHGFGRGEYQYFAHPLPPAVPGSMARASLSPAG